LQLIANGVMNEGIEMILPYRQSQKGGTHGYDFGNQSRNRLPDINQDIRVLGGVEDVQAHEP
jgi:hypothetical protein